MTASRQTSVGRMGEFFVAYVFEKNGIEAHHVDLSGADLWCKLPSGKIVTVQVKTTTGLMQVSKKAKRKYYRFHTATSKDVDWFVFVSLDVEKMRIFHKDEIKYKVWTMNPHDFTDQAQRDDIERFIS